MPYVLFNLTEIKFLFINPLNWKGLRNNKVPASLECNCQMVT